MENLKVLYQAITQSKPTTVKGPFVASMSLNSTMGPGIRFSAGGGSAFGGKI
jgi:ribosomal protein L1